MISYNANWTTLAEHTLRPKLKFNTMSIDIAKRQTTKTYYFFINNMGLS